MTTPSIAPECLVERAVHDAIGADGDATGLRFSLRNPSTEPMLCERVDLTLPIGTGPQHLAAAPGRLALAEGSGWALRHTGGDSFALVPGDPAELRPGAPLTLTLEGVGAGTEPGNAPFTAVVHALVGGQRAPAATARFDVCTLQTRMLDYFKAENLSVERDKSTTLTWKGLPRKTSKIKPTYWLYQGAAARRDVTLEMDEATGVGSRPTGALTSSTAFMMLAETTDESGTKPVTEGLTAAVTVVKPDLVTGRLQANGQVLLLKEPKAINPDHGKVRTQAFGSGELAAGTDGMIAVNILTDVEKKTATTRVTVTASGLSHLHQAGAVKGFPANLLVPVPSGARALVWAGAGGAAYTLRASWYPMGTGALNKK